MLRIEKHEIEHSGATPELLTDTSMILDFIYDRLKGEIGHFEAAKILLKLPLLVLKRKRRERKDGISKSSNAKTGAC